MTIHYSKNGTPMISGFYWYIQQPEKLLLVCLIVDNVVVILGDTERIDLPTFFRMECKKGIEIIGLVENNFNYTIQQ